MNRFAIILVFCLFFIKEVKSQQPFKCALDYFIEQSRLNDPDFDIKMQEQEEVRNQWKNNLNKNSSTVLTIPVVVHVVYYNAQDSILDSQVFSQIDILNQDYMRLNADTSNTPSVFNGMSANPNIQFCLASKDPQGNSTTGITYTKTNKTSFALVSGDTSIWHTVKGGYDGWDSTKYLNIWVADISPAGGIGFWPGAVFPGHREGVVINYTFFGTMGAAIAPYNLGRTATHEIGHYLDLHHLWGDASSNSSCTGTDYCNDTPTQVTASQNCPTFPKTDACSTSSPGLMFMNFMDYPQDACRNMFSADQVTRMRACLTNIRSSLLSSQACTSVSGIKENNLENSFRFYPNPSKGLIHVSNISEMTSVKIFDSLGKLVLETILSTDSTIDLMGVSNGLYLISIQNKKEISHFRLVIAK